MPTPLPAQPSPQRNNGAHLAFLARFVERSATGYVAGTPNPTIVSKKQNNNKHINHTRDAGLSQASDLLWIERGACRGGLHHSCTLRGRCCCCCLLTKQSLALELGFGKASGNAWICRCAAQGDLCLWELLDIHLRIPACNSKIAEQVSACVQQS